MPFRRSNFKVGVYVDSANIYRNGGQKMKYDVLRVFACRDDAEPIRLNAYVTCDAIRAKRDDSYRDGNTGFHSALRDFGYKVIVKEVIWYHDETGSKYGKANADLDLAVDALLQSENLDRVLIASGDGDFVKVVRALQNKGCRVEVVALDNVSKRLREEADMFMSGYLIPNLIPVESTQDLRAPWGATGSRVRGHCRYRSDQGFGFFSFLKTLESSLWLKDDRVSDSPYETVFFRDKDLPEGVDPASLPSRDYIFEFELAKSESGDKPRAVEIKLVSTLSS